MKLKVAVWVLGAVAVTLVVLAIAAALGSRSERLRKLVVATLEDRLNSDVELRAFSVDAYPSVVIRGEGLVLRLRGATKGPPLIQIDSFTVHCGLMDLVRRPRRFKHVTLEGLVINIPPGGLKEQGNPIGDALKDNAPSESQGARKDSTAKEVARAAEHGEAAIIVDELLADGALLRIIPRKAGKAPKEFAIHALTMNSLGFGQKMPFRATLTNPLPKGRIETSGTFGPWQKDDPSKTPLGGRYTFDNADLDTIKGIGGILSSTGEFGGELERIAVKGETRTPDFHLDVSGQPVPLDTTFEAVVDGTDGDTYLNRVDATFLRTSLSAKGAIAGAPGVKGRTIRLHVQIHKGRIEDLLRLTTRARKPAMVGNVALHTDFTLPPGEADVIERLRLSGAFDVHSASFTEKDIQRKLTGMSARARGLDPEDAKADNVVSDLRGEFRLAAAVVTFPQLSFMMPGATVQLHGTYGLRKQALGFEGTLRMQATVSQAAGGGMKSVLLKIVDPLFRKKGAGAVIPIRISGTAEDPKFGLDVGKVFKK